MQDLPDRPFLASALEDLERKIKQGKAKRIPIAINGKPGFGIEYTNMFIVVSKIEVKDILRKVAHLCLGKQYVNSAKAIRRAKHELCQRFNIKYKTTFYPAKIIVCELEELPESADFYVKLISENLRSQGKAPFCYDSEETENNINNLKKLMNTGYLLNSFRLDREAFDMIRDGSYGQAEAMSDWAQRKLAFNDSQVRAEPIEENRRWEPQYPTQEPVNFPSTRRVRDNTTLRIHLTDEQRRHLIALLQEEMEDCTILIDSRHMRVES